MNTSPYGDATLRLTSATLSTSRSVQVVDGLLVCNGSLQDYEELIRTVLDDVFILARLTYRNSLSPQNPLLGGVLQPNLLLK